MMHGCNTEKPPTPKDLLAEAIIPIPSSVISTGLSFLIDENTSISTTSDLESIERFAELLRASTGFALEVSPYDGGRAANQIQFVEATLPSSTPESYKINISPKRITITASDESGIQYGISTLKQLIPIEVLTGADVIDPIVIASGDITDSPRFAYRGAMLDVARHFFTIDDVKNYIDYLAVYKINHLHLHLSDDQGWRIEIKSRPLLTKVGSLTQVGGGTGGFYTQSQYRDLVKYAAQRSITIVPEIDMPGHTNAALVSYPELNCNAKDPKPKPYTGMRVGFSSLCTDSELVYEFVDDVIRELAEMTPGDYIHIGGDESHVTAKDDYIRFVDRVHLIVGKYGKKVVGWDEIAQSNLPAGAMVQYWAGAKNAELGVIKGAKVLLSPANKTYLDMQYDSTSTYGLHWAGYIEVDSAYLWDPAAAIDSINESDIIGIESPLWSETIQTLDEIEYLAFPRVIGHAEIGWSAQSHREWTDYASRLSRHLPRLQALGVSPYLSPKIDWIQKNDTLDNLPNF